MVVSVLSITFLGKSGNGQQTESANIEATVHVPAANQAQQAAVPSNHQE
jgi:hypothetical protein